VKKQGPRARQVADRRTQGLQAIPTAPSYHHESARRGARVEHRVPHPSRRSTYDETRNRDQPVPRPPNERFLDDAAVEALKPPGWLVEGLIPRRATVLIYGESGILKSFVAQGLAYSVATGHSWLGNQVTKGRAVYVAAEGRWGLGARSRAWKKANGFDGKVGVLFYPDALDMGPPTRDLRTQPDVEPFIDDLRPVKPTLVIIDTVARCLIGGDENSSRDMGYLVAAADKTRKELGATVVLIHHPVKKGQSERGSGALKAAMDTVILMRREGSLIEFVCKKQKDDDEFPTMYLRRRVVPLGAGLSSCVVEVAKGARPSVRDRLTEKQWEALIALQSFGKGGAKSGLWLAKTGFPEKTFHNVKNTLLVLKLITGGHSTPFKLTATANRLLKDRNGSLTTPTAATAPPLGDRARGSRKGRQGRKRKFSMRPGRGEDGDEDEG
jgi:AAA domain-containing protein